MLLFPAHIENCTVKETSVISTAAPVVAAVSVVAAAVVVVAALTAETRRTPGSTLSFLTKYTPERK